MTSDEVLALRKVLACTAKELARALDLEQATVLAWERGELFPTKQYIDKMSVLREKGPSAIPRMKKAQTPMQALRDPAFWEIVRKIASHQKLRDEVTKLAAGYPDPD